MTEIKKILVESEGQKYEGFGGLNISEEVDKKGEVGMLVLDLGGIGI